MKHDELLARIDYLDEVKDRWNGEELAVALRALVELHKPVEFSPAWKPKCDYCEIFYPCLTIQTIKKGLS